MKGTLKILGRTGLALLLAAVLMVGVIPAAPVEAATAVTNVWVQFPSGDFNKTNTVTAYRIYFTPTTALKRGVDTITVWFPDGSTEMGPDNFVLTNAVATASSYSVDRDGESTTYSVVAATDNATLSTTGYRITVKTPVDISAGAAASLTIAAGAGVKTAVSASHDQYKVKVYTSKDTTPVLSEGFDIDATGPTGNVVVISPATAGVAGQYTFTLTLPNALTANTDTITVIFPLKTTVPSSIAATDVAFQNDTGNWETATATPVVNQKARMVTAKTSIALAGSTNQRIRFATSANIVNNTTAYTTDDGFFAFTSLDELQFQSTVVENVIAGAANKIGFTSASDSASIINGVSDAIVIQIQDANSNLVATTTPITGLTTSGTGAFYSDTAGSTLVTTMPGTSGTATVYYKGTAAGTVTLTATASGLTNGTRTFTVAPAVSLYNSSGDLISTFAPPSSGTPANEATAGNHGADYVQSAITAAVTGDVVKLGDGVYEVDTVITLDRIITLTSVNGASATTLKPTASGLTAIMVGVSGTATTPVIIDGLKFDKATDRFARAIYNNGWNYVTVQNNTFTNVRPTVHADDQDAGNVVAFVSITNVPGSGAAITSGTINNNTFTGNTVSTFSTSDKPAMINVMNKIGDKTISGVTVSGNTITSSDGIGIMVSGYSAAMTVRATISGNTITDSVAPLSIQRYTTNVKVTGNTVSGGYMYALRVESTDHDNLVIKNNTFTGTARGSSADAAVRIDADGSGTPVDDVVLQYNDFTSNNSTYSITVAASTTVDAKYNYYGSASGPGSSVNKGTSATVTTSPWLHKSRADVVADNASYQAVKMSLVAGWNTLSTPVKLIAAADAIDELITSGLTIGYYYSSSGAWTQITSGYVLSPGDAVYLKMSAATDVLLKFDASAFSMPSKSLIAGWNLVGLAALSDGGKNADLAVASVAKTASGLPGYSQVISPSINSTQTDMYGMPGTVWTVSNGQASVTDKMYAGLGYWIYMQNAATLAGFEITPLAPNLN